MKSINMNVPIYLKDIFDKYGKNADEIIDIKIGYDDRIYILLSDNIPERIQGVTVSRKADAVYSAIVLTVDWFSGELLNSELYNFGRHTVNFHDIQPIGNRILLLGARTDGEDNAYIVEKDGSIYRKLYFGDGIEDCIVTSQGEIIIGYFDEGIFGNGEKSGLTIWNENGEKIWKNTRYMIMDCYGINIDEKENLWFYYYNEFSLVKTDFKHDTVFQCDIKNATDFLLTMDTRHILFYSGYDRERKLTSALVQYNKLTDYEETAILYNGEELSLTHINFRSSKAIFVDNSERMFIKNMIQLE